jgi:hypothetical protein
MNKKQFALVLFCLIQFCIPGKAQDSSTIRIQDLTSLLGCWQGSITYLDYRSGKAFSMPAQLKIINEPGSELFFFFNIYPDEPKANSKDSFLLSTDGKKLNEETVHSVKRSSGNHTEFITEILAKDGNDNKPALLRYTYLISQTHFTRRKDVKFVGTTSWIRRNEFKYTRMNCIE